MTAACAALGASLSGEPAQPFALPVKESAFELRARELFSMGENALDSRDWLGALSYFHELRGKLSSEVGTADYALVSALLGYGLYRINRMRLTLVKERQVRE